MVQQSETRSILASCLRVLVVVVLAMTLLFMYLLQRVKSRELERDISSLKTEQAEAVKALNQLDARIDSSRVPSGLCHSPVSFGHAGEVRGLYRTAGA